MGTPDFAVGALSSLIEAGHDIAGVVTQPDRPKGRGGKVTYPPVKEEALKHGIDILQPQKVKDEKSVSWIREKMPDLIVAAAFGQILSREILDIPKYGCINIHASLLPKYRGASPIQQAVIDGEAYSGITIMMMEEGLDTGDIIMQKSIRIEDDDTGGSLHDKLAALGAQLITQAVEAIENGTYTRTPQGDDYTYAGIIDKKTGLIDFSMDADKIERLIRGLNPWPSAYTYIGGKLLKIWSARAENTDCDGDITGVQHEGEITAVEHGGEPGEITAVEHNSFLVKTGRGTLRILELQPEGKRRMKASDYMNGTDIRKGMVLGK